MPIVAATGFLLAVLAAGTARADVPPGFALKWGGSGKGPGQFGSPQGVACDASGNVYVADFGNDRVQKFTGHGIFVTEWGTRGSGDGQLTAPAGICVDPAGDVYVTEFGNVRVSKFSSNGTFLLKWGSAGSGPGQFDAASDIGFDAAGNAYVVDANNDRVEKFTSAGVYLGEWGSRGSNDGEFYGPNGLAVDSDDRIYVLDGGNDRVQVFDTDGHFLKSWGGSDQLSYAFGIALDTSHHVFVSDGDADRILKFTTDGTLLTSWGAPGVGDGYFDGPLDLALDASGNVFVTDTYNNLIQKFDPTIPPPPPRPDYVAKILLHLTSPVTKNVCASGLLSDCSQAVVRGDVSTPAEPRYYFAHLLAARGRISSFAGLQFGISYDRSSAGLSDGQGVDIFAWTLCATLEFHLPDWPAPGSGNLITWDFTRSCQFGETAVAGYFYLAAYSPDILSVTPRPVDGRALVADCIPRLFELEPGDLGYVAFSARGSIPGCNPCLMDCAHPILVKPTTWSAIKSLFR